MPKRRSSRFGERSPRLAADRRRPSPSRRPTRPLVERLDARIVPAVIAPALGASVDALAADTAGVKNAYAVAVGDVTGDSIPDLVYLAGNVNTGFRLHVEKNGALPGASDPELTTLNGRGFDTGLMFPTAVRIADIDGDGWNDIIVHGAAESKLRGAFTVLLNQLKLGLPSAAAAFPVKSTVVYPFG